MSKISQIYSENGVLVSKTSINVGDEIIITYNGLLSRSGAQQVSLHYGYGEEWKEKSFLTAGKEDTTFKFTLKANLSGNLNFCFSDPADNWDNNNFSNYSLKINSKSSETVSIEVKAEQPKIEEVKAKEPKVEKVKAKEPKVEAPEEKKASTKKTAVKTTVAKKTTKKTS